MKTYTLGTDGIIREHKKGNWVRKREVVAKVKTLAKALNRMEELELELKETKSRLEISEQALTKRTNRVLDLEEQRAGLRVQNYVISGLLLIAIVIGYTTRSL